MPVFARRRLQAMLDELSPLLRGGKGLDLLRRLNRKEVEQALPAEMELALLWSIARLGDLEVEPGWWGDGRRPDAFTEALVPGQGCAIEIAAPSDNAISGEADMDRIARQIAESANEVRKGMGDYLYFTFLEESGFVNGRYVRRRLAPSDYALSSRASEIIQTWAASEELLAYPLELRDGRMAVNVKREAYKQTRYHNIHSSMPAETHSLDENPLFELLERKMRQLRGAQPGTLRIIFLADAGSTLLRSIGRYNSPSGLTKSGTDIINYFLARRSASIDAVVAFSPHKETSFLGRDPLGRKPRRWNVSFFGTPALPKPPEALERIAEMLPAPHYEGYQARLLFRQGSFSPLGTGQYLGMTIRGNHGEGKFSVELPARMLLDLLAGRLSEERFRRQLGGRSGNENIFKLWLDKGFTMSGAEMLPRDLDEDDDHIVLHFTDDPAARPFRLSDEDAPPSDDASGTG
jgi:hypothetical protein